jgi:hypothetical protein
MDVTLSFEAWSEKFLMASAAGSNKPASSTGMEVQEDIYQHKALTFETPAKRKRSVDKVAIELVTGVPYSLLFKDDKELVLGALLEVSGLLSRFDQSCLSMNQALHASVGQSICHNQLFVVLHGVNDWSSGLVPRDSSGVACAQRFFWLSTRPHWPGPPSQN